MSRKHGTLPDGYMRFDGQLSPDAMAAVKRALAGGDAKAVVVIPSGNFTTVAGTPNRLFGSYINEDGDAV